MDRIRDTIENRANTEIRTDFIKARRGERYGAVHEFDKQGRKAAQNTKENISKGKNQLEKRREAQRQEVIKITAEKAQTTTRIVPQSGQPVTDPHPESVLESQQVGSTVAPQSSPTGGAYQDHGPTGE